MVWRVRKVTASTAVNSIHWRVRQLTASVTGNVTDVRWRIRKVTATVVAAPSDVRWRIRRVAATVSTGSTVTVVTARPAEPGSRILIEARDAAGAQTVGGTWRIASVSGDAQVPTIDTATGAAILIAPASTDGTDVVVGYRFGATAERFVTIPVLRSTVFVGPTMIPAYFQAFIP